MEKQEKNTRETGKDVTVTFSEMNIIGLPLFSFNRNLSEKERFEVIEREWTEYRGTKKITRRIRIQPSPKYGMMSDFDYLVLQSIFLYIRKNNLIPVPERIIFKPIDIENCVKELTVSSENTNRAKQIKDSLFRMRECSFDFDDYILSKTNISERERSTSLLYEVIWQNESKKGRKSTLDNCEIVLSLLLRENINNNLVMLFAIDSMKNLKTLSKRSYQFLFTKWFALGKLRKIGTFPSTEKKIVYKKNYKDFITLFLLKPHKEKWKVGMQLESVLEELKEHELISTYEVSGGKEEYIVTIVSGAGFIEDLKQINSMLQGAKNEQTEMDLSDDIIEYDEDKEAEIHRIEIEKVKQVDKGMYRRLRLRVNYKMRQGFFEKKFTADSPMYTAIMNSLLYGEIMKEKKTRGLF